MLKVQDLRTEFATRDGVVHAVNGISFTVERGQLVGIVGESGFDTPLQDFKLFELIEYKGGLRNNAALVTNQIS